MLPCFLAMPEDPGWNPEWSEQLGEAGTWDDVRGGVLRAADVEAARAEEIKYMVGRKIFFTSHTM